MNYFIAIILSTYYLAYIKGQVQGNAATPNDVSRRFLDVIRRQALQPLAAYETIVDLVGLLNPNAEVDYELIKEYTKTINNQGFWLYTRKNVDSPQYLQYDDRSSVVQSYYDPTKVTVVLVHGWNGHGNDMMNKLLRQAFLKHGAYNVIVLDWSQLALGINYNTAKTGTAAVGRNLGRFINWLVKIGYGHYNQMHLVGFSLGGHLVGNAGRETGGKIARITGLDPAGPFWYAEPDRLTSKDAKYVEVIHTNTRLTGIASSYGFGISDPCGDADFYPNGGGMMNGCMNSNICSHSRSYEYMARSLETNKFWARKCNSYKEILLNICLGSYNLMGGSELKKKGRGLYRVNTLPTYPFVI